MRKPRDAGGAYRERIQLSEQWECAGPSIREQMEARLLKACRRYVSLNEAPLNRLGDELTITRLRWKIRGMAEMIVIMTGPYEFSERDMITVLEKEFMGRAREAALD